MWHQRRHRKLGAQRRRDLHPIYCDVVEPPCHERAIDAPEQVLVREVEQVDVLAHLVRVRVRIAVRDRGRVRDRVRVRVSDVLAHQVARTRLVTLGEHQLHPLGARAVQAELGGHVEVGELDLVVEARRHLVRVKN